VAARLPHLGAVILAVTTAAACQRPPETSGAAQAPPETIRGDTVALTGLRLIDARDKLEVPTSAAKQTEWAQSPATAKARRGLAQAMRNVKILSDAGIPIVMGTDSGGRLDAGRFPASWEHEEMDLYFQSGMTPMQIIVSATGGAARAMAIDKELGTLQSGKWADFVVLNANPLDHFRKMHDINAVWIAGHPLRAATAGTQ